MITKITSLTTVTVLSMSLLFTNCKKKEEAAPAVTTTPAATTTTTTPTTSSPYNLKCKVDGKEFNCTNGKGTIYSTIILQIAANDATNALTGIVINMQIDSIKVGTYKFSKSGYGSKVSGSYVDNGANSKEYRTTVDSETNGLLTVTKVDASAKKISGTFNFTATGNNTTTGTVVVTDGEFTDITW